jgi:DMSO/TMAO reductase YedYZ molybdopterin-dependent catalytic subunit
MSVEKTARRTWGRASEGTLVGAGAGMLAVGFEILVRTVSGLPSPIELLGDQGTRFIPGPLFEALLEMFGHTAKYLYFTGILLAQVAGLALLTALAFALRGLVIRRRALAAVADDDLTTDDSADPDNNQASSRDADDQLATPPDYTDYTPAQRAALAAAVPTIQMPVGWWFGAMLASLAWLLSGILVLPFMGAGPFGANLPQGTEIVMISLLAPALAFGASLPLCQRGLRWLAPQLIGSPGLQRTFSPGRRLFIKRVSVGVVIVGMGALAWRFITQGFGSGSAADASSLDGPPPPERITPAPTPHYGAWHAVDGETPELTSVNDFYYVSKNVYMDPSLDAGSWQLAVNGAGVEHPFTLSYQDLITLPAVEQITTLECISNVIGGNLMSSASFQGVRLKDLLARAGVKAGSTKVAFHAADRYTDSIHLSKALDPMTLLVYKINGQPLPEEHGFPARMIVPGIYGMKHCKWITQIEVVNYNFLGYWQQEGWNDDAVINLGARIDVPFDGASLPANRQTTIAGVAFAGAKGVSAVDVSTDNGGTWKRATLKQPLGAVTWTLWELPWEPASRDSYAIVARMIDLQGYYQQPVLADPYPSGATGYHRIYVTTN